MASEQHNKNGVTGREITEEMRESYLDYAMSVIVARALPDVRDGLKPVHRRILYAMHELGLGHTAKFRKSASVVGEVLGKYHPHGDTAVYDSLVRMAQDFAFRYPLINGQGNFGSIDGDSAAAMRYTECRMTRFAEYMLRDIEKETVDFVSNYDNSKKEPTVLPASVPQLLANGSLGIAVGMATNIPPHNVGELADAAIHLINNPQATVEDLMQFVHGPDFPTGGIIFNKKDILSAYTTGRGGIVTRGEAEIVETKQGAFQIIATSIPYQVNKAQLLEKIADLVREKKIDGIKDLRDESDKDGLRIAIDLKAGSFPQNVLNNLYKHTDLERVYHFNMLALVDGIQPHILSLKTMLEEFIKHRGVVVEKRTRFDLAKAEERAHILEGLKKALHHIDAVIKTIKASEDREDAHKNLISQFALSDRQATAILEMRLQTLAGLERRRVEDELKEKQELIKDLKAILQDPKKISHIVQTETAALKKDFPEMRRTRIVAGAAKMISQEDLVPEEEAAIVVTRGGYIKRINPQEYRTQRRGGKGIIGLTTKEEDVVDLFLTAHTHDELLFFTSLGKVYQIKAYDIPEGSRTAKGKSVVNFLMLAPDEQVTALLPLPKKEKRVPCALAMITRGGIIKKTAAELFHDVRRKGIIAIRLEKGDQLGWVECVTAKDELMLITQKGMAIRFKESDVRAMGRASSGVWGIRLQRNDSVVGVGAARRNEKETEILVVAANGYGKKTPLKEYRTQKRGGGGIKTLKVTAKTGPVVAARVVYPEETDLVAISQKGQVIRMSLQSVSTLGRATQGVRIMKLDAGDHVASVTTL